VFFCDEGLLTIESFSWLVAVRSVLVGESVGGCDVRFHALPVVFLLCRMFLVGRWMQASNLLIQLATILVCCLHMVGEIYVLLTVCAIRLVFSVLALLLR